MRGWMIAANRPDDGIVVFLGARGWTDEIDRANIAIDESGTKALVALGRQSEAVHEIKGAHLVEVSNDGRLICPLQLWREAESRAG